MNCRIKFSDLRKLLLDIGFSEVSTPEAVVVFGHRASDTLFVFRPYKPSEPVASHNLLDVRRMLDAPGVHIGRHLRESIQKDPGVTRTRWSAARNHWHAACSPEDGGSWRRKTFAIGWRPILERGSRPVN